MPAHEAFECFMRCCGSVNWANQMVSRRPFANISDLMQEGSAVWRELSSGDWLEAFSKHPAIGEKNDSGWSREEQCGAEASSPEKLAELKELNRKYFDKFGFVFLLFATGKSLDEMVSELKKRLLHAREEELAIASREQQKILRLRLEKLSKEK